MSSALEREFIARWKQLAPTYPLPECEYRFHGKRRWRFDFAWPRALVAVEVEGGTWQRGRHTRGAGYRGDCEKYNAAAVNGWRVLRFTAGMLRDDPFSCIEQVVSLLNGALPVA